MGPHEPVGFLGSVRQSVLGPHGSEIHGTVRARLKTRPACGGKDTEAWAPRHREQARARAKYWVVQKKVEWAALHG